MTARVLEPVERPILFTGLMVRAILEGSKTQTRRIVDPNPMGTHASLVEVRHGPWRGPTFDFRYADHRKTALAHCPYGVPGDRLWVRETWQTWQPAPSGYVYAADWLKEPGPRRWRPSIHMPRKASRILLEVTAVRVERLQDITEDDARAEGVPVSVRRSADAAGKMGPEVGAFRELWDAINGKRAPWKSNPWVWVVTFTNPSARAAQEGSGIP